MIIFQKEITFEKGDLLRQSGKSTRIINHIAEQLFSVGEVISTDHTVFEYPGKIKTTHINNFIKRVKSLVEFYSHGSKTITSEIKKLNDIPLVHFKIKNTQK